MAPERPPEDATAGDARDVAFQQQTERRHHELARALEDQKDLLERERALGAELEAANRAKDRLLEILSQELRRPLNAVVGWTALLRREPLDKASRDRALATIEKNALFQAAILDQLLDVSRLTSGHLPLEVRGVDVVQVLREAVQLVQARAEERKVSIALRSVEHAVVLGDSFRLREAIGAVITNAVGAAPSGGRVAVDAATVDDRIRVSVSDDGAGFALEKLPFLFDCPEQPNELSLEGSKVYLGLFMAKMLLELHRGHVTATSDGPGKGATLTIELPLRHPTSLPPPMPPASSGMNDVGEAVDERALRGHDVLVVGVDDDTRDLLVLILGHHGARVTIAADGEAASDACSARPPAVVISELALPDERGDELVARIRALERGSGARIGAIALVDASRFGPVGSAPDVFDARLGKPLVPADVVSAVARLARGTPRA